MKVQSIRKHERTLLKGIFLVSLLVLVVLGATVVFIHILQTNPRSDLGSKGWQKTPQVRIIMDSTADWGRIMFNDLYGTNANGVRIAEFASHGWLLGGNENDDRIDAGRSLTFIDVIYNGTVVRTGDIVGFFKGNNDFKHTKMFADLVLEVNMDMTAVSVYLMLAGAGTTTFQFINKETGVLIWEDTETGRSVTLYIPRSTSPQAFFTVERIDTLLVLALIAGAIAIIVVLNPIYLPKDAEAEPKKETGGL